MSFTVTSRENVRTVSKDNEKLSYQTLPKRRTVFFENKAAGIFCGLTQETVNYTVSCADADGARFAERPTGRPFALCSAITISGTRTIWQMIPGIASRNAPLRNSWNENVVFVSPIRANRAAPQTMRPISMERIRLT